jgi:hypothetical protein
MVSLSGHALLSIFCEVAAANVLNRKWSQCKDFVGVWVTDKINPTIHYEIFIEEGVAAQCVEA